jgi:hypothetical protein
LRTLRAAERVALDHSYAANTNRYSNVTPNTSIAQKKLPKTLTFNELDVTDTTCYSSVIDVSSYSEATFREANTCTGIDGGKKLLASKEPTNDSSSNLMKSVHSSSQKMVGKSNLM